MAVDILTIVANKGAENVAGKILTQYYGVTFSSSYPPTGYTFPELISTRYGQIGIRRLLAVIQRATNTAGVAYNVEWDNQAGFLHVFQNGIEVAANTNLSTIQLHLKLEGTR